MKKNWKLLVSARQIIIYKKIVRFQIIKAFSGLRIKYDKYILHNFYEENNFQ